MITEREALFIAICFEGFLYGLYSAIFAIYLQCSSNESRTATIVFYAICLLYVLSTVTFVGDWVALILINGVVLSIRPLSVPQIDSQPELMLSRLRLARGIVCGCCEFIAQFIIIYRCWIVWGKSIRVVIIPSFLAIACLAIWLVSMNAIMISVQFLQFERQSWIIVYASDWDSDAPALDMALTSYVTSMVVNALVTGLIVFKILKVFLEVKATCTSVERTLGSTGGTKLRHIIFIIIESGLALFAAQLVRVVLYTPGAPLWSPPDLYDFVIVINQMFNGIAPTVILVRVAMRLSFDDKDSDSFKEAVGSLRFNNPPSDPDTHRQIGILGSGSTSMPPQESLRSEGICFNNPPSDPFRNTLRRMESSSSMPPQERSGDTYD